MSATRLVELLEAIDVGLPCSETDLYRGAILADMMEPGGKADRSAKSSACL